MRLLLPAPPAGWPQKPAGISLCMIVRDEQRFLPEALQSVEGIVDEICIADTGSKDRTLEIARTAGARIREIAWEDDFSKARNASLEMATRRWIFVLDADERLAPRSREILTAVASLPAYLTGLWTRCYNFTDEYKGTNAVSNALVRVFPNHERIRYRNRIHEIIALDGSEDGLPALNSEIAIIHLGYAASVMRDRKKGERNLAMAELVLSDDPGNPFNWYNYAVSASLLNKTETAVSALEKMRELSQARTRARGDGRVQSFVANGTALLGTLYLSQGRNDRAEELAREMLTYAGTLADAHFLLGKALAAQRRFREARDAFIAAIEDGKNVELHPMVDNEIPLWKAQCEIGSTLMQEGGYELALAWFEFALKARPDIQLVRLNRARALEALARFDDARESFAGVWRDSRDNLSANEYVNYLLRRDQSRDALAFIEEAAPQLPPESQLIFYGSAAAIASRGGLPGTDRYLSLAENVEGVTDVRSRLESLLLHLAAAGALERLAAKSAPAKAVPAKEAP